MRAAHTMNCVRLQQHPTMKSMHNALPFRSSGNFQARPQLAGISSSKVRCALLKQQAAKHVVCLNMISHAPLLPRLDSPLLL
jgi:hypothetical protein